MALKFNIDKCKVLHLKFNDNLNLEYKLNGIIMTESEQEKDLGVITSAQCAQDGRKWK